jgi:hypothetical protein
LFGEKGTTEFVRAFVEAVTGVMDVPIKREAEVGSLICEEETIASEKDSNSSESPGKKVFTVSSEYQRIESVIYEGLISALQKL